MHRDAFGQPISPGDKVVWARSITHGCKLERAEIVSLTEKMVKVQIVGSTYISTVPTHKVVVLP